MVTYSPGSIGVALGSLIFFGRPTVFVLFGDFGPVLVMKCVKISVCFSK